MMNLSERMTRVFSNKTVVAARRQPINLRRMLFSSKFDFEDNHGFNRLANVIGPCTNLYNPPRPGRKCLCCDMWNIGTKFHFANDQNPFKIHFAFNCDTVGFLYTLTCNGCGGNYIGKCDRSIRERAGEHWRAIQENKFTLGVQKHIAVFGAAVFSMAPFYIIRPKNRGPTYTLLWADFFIDLKKPKLNHIGLS